jgi:hypothetical protein
MEAWRLKMEPWRGYRLMVADLKRSWNRTRIEVETWIRIRIEVMRIRNLARKLEHAMRIRNLARKL